MITRYFCSDWGQGTLTSRWHMTWTGGNRPHVLFNPMNAILMQKRQTYAIPVNSTGCRVMTILMHCKQLHNNRLDSQEQLLSSPPEQINPNVDACPQACLVIVQLLWLVWRNACKLCAAQVPSRTHLWVACDKITKLCAVRHRCLYVEAALEMHVTVIACHVRVGRGHGCLSLQTFVDF